MPDHASGRANIQEWLLGLGLERYADVFHSSDIGLDVLADLTDADLKELGVSLGDRKRMLKAASLLRERREPAPASEPTAERRSAHGHVRRPGWLDRAQSPP